MYGEISTNNLNSQKFPCYNFMILITNTLVSIFFMFNKNWNWKSTMFKPQICRWLLFLSTKQFFSISPDSLFIQLSITCVTCCHGNRWTFLNLWFFNWGVWNSKLTCLWINLWFDFFPRDRYTNLFLFIFFFWGGGAWMQCKYFIHK